MRWIALATLGLVCTGAEAQSLELSEVWASADRHHPRIASVLADQQSAEAELLAAEGGFDPRLSAYGALRTGGYYELRRATVELRQPTPFWGAEIWTGYRLGRGIEEERFPSYYSDETLDDGEFRAGIRVPLWRDGPLDQRRAQRAKRSSELTAASRKRDATRLEIRQQATDAYFAWAAAGRRLRIAEELRSLARDRQTWVRARAQAGAIAQVDVLEAERAVLQREQAVVASRRGTQAASFVLALFYRDAEGTPKLPRDEAVPATLAQPRTLPRDRRAATAAALRCHPRIAGRAAELAAARVERDLARAQNAPQIDLQAQFSRDFGQGNETLPGNVVEAGVTFSMPLAMRTPRGQARAAEARARAVEEDLRLIRDSVRLKLADAASAFAAARQRHRFATRATKNARELAAAEQRRLEAGTTTLFVVNLREQTIGATEIAEVDAMRDLWQARAGWDALTACEINN